MRSSLERRSGIERRHVSYAAHIPERRSGTDRRASHNRRGGLSGAALGKKPLKEMDGTDLKEEE